MRFGVAVGSGVEGQGLPITEKREYRRKSIEEEEGTCHLPSFYIKLKKIGEGKFDISIAWAYKLHMALPCHPTDTPVANQL